MSGFVNINTDLDKVSQDIQSATYEVDIAREEYLLKKADYDDAYAKVKLMTKAKNPKATQTDLEAEAETQTHAIRLAFVMKDSTYHKAQNKLQALRDRLSACQEISYNLRREVSIGR